MQLEWILGPKLRPQSASPLDHFPSCVQEVAEHRPRGFQERPKSAQERPKSAQEQPKRAQGPPKVPPEGYFLVHFFIFPCFSAFFHVFMCFLCFCQFFCVFFAFLVILFMLFCAFLRFCMFSVFLRVTTFFWIVLRRSLPCTGRILVFFVYVSL